MRKILIFIFIIFILGAANLQAEIVVIIHGATHVTSINQKMIKDIFTGKKTVWDDNTKITFVTLKGGELHKDFLRQYVQKNPTQYKNFWKQQIFLGKAAKAPDALESLDDLIEYVANNPGSISYMSSEKDISNQNINEIFIVK